MNLIQPFSSCPFDARVVLKLGLISGAQAENRRVSWAWGGAPKWRHYAVCARFELEAGEEPERVTDNDEGVVWARIDVLPFIGLGRVGLETRFGVTYDRDAIEMGCRAMSNAGVRGQVCAGVVLKGSGGAGCHDCSVVGFETFVTFEVERI